VRMRRWRQVRLAGLALFIFVGLSAGGVRPSRANDVFSVTLQASDQAGKPVADACFHWTLVQTGPADQARANASTAFADEAVA